MDNGFNMFSAVSVKNQANSSSLLSVDLLRRVHEKP